MPGAAVHRAEGRHHRRARVVRPSRCRRRPRRGSTCRCRRRDTASRPPGRRRPSRSSQAGSRPGRGPSPMSTSSTSPQRLRAGSSRWHGLSSPKVTVRVAANGPSGTAPVSASTPEGRSTATIGTLQRASAIRPARRPASGSPARPPMPSTPSSTRSSRSGCAGVGVVQLEVIECRSPAAGGEQGGQPALRAVRRGSGRRVTRRPAGPAGRRRTGRRRRCCPGRPGSAPGAP